MRRFLLGLMIILATIVVILLFIRDQNYYQRFPDYSQFSSAADLQAYLNQKLEVGKSTEAEVESFIIQSGIASKIGSDSICTRGQWKTIIILCTVRAPTKDYSNESWLPQIMNLTLEYYHISFEIEDSKLKQMDVGFESSWAG